MRERWRNSSLQTFLLIQFAAALCIVVVAFLYTSIQALNASTQEALQERSVVAQLIANRMDEQLDRVIQSMRGILAARELNLEDGELQRDEQLLQSTYDHSVLFKRLSILDPSGKVVALVPYDPQMMGVNVATAPYNRRMDLPLDYPISLAIGVRSQTPAIAITLPISNLTGSAVGYLHGWIDLADPRAATFLYPYEPTNGYADLIDQTGTVLLSSRAGRVGQSSDHAGHLGTLIHNKHVTVETCHSCHDPLNAVRQNDVLAFAPLQHVPWGIALHEAEATVFAKTRDLAFRLIGLGLLVLIAVFVLAWTTARGIVIPLRGLTAACQSIALGNLTSPVPVTGRVEMRMLAQSFEDMRRSLLFSRGQMFAAQVELECRVEERTNELAQNRDFLLKTNRNLNTLNQTAAILIHSLDLANILSAAIKQVIQGLDADAGGIFLIDENEPELVLYASQGLPTETLSAINRLTCPDFADGAKLSSDRSKARWLEKCRRLLSHHINFVSILDTPLEAKDKLIGVLFVASHHPSHFEVDDGILLSTLGWQIAMTIHNARLYETVQRREKDHAAMLNRVITAQEAERKRIARELHDETGQGLGALMLGLDTLDAALISNPSEVAQIQETSRAIVQGMIEGIRRITTDLRPSLLDDLGLVPAIAWYGEKRLKPVGIALDLNADKLTPRLSADHEIALFRIIQEAITNVIRHAHATQVSIRLDYQDETLTLQVTDNGRGFDPQTVHAGNAADRAFGLRGIRERCDILGGTLDLKTLSGQGTTIMVRVPIREQR